VGLTLAEGLWLALGVGLGEALSDGLALALSLEEGLVLGLTLALSLALGEGEGVELGVGDTLAEAVGTAVIPFISRREIVTFCIVVQLSTLKRRVSPSVIAVVHPDSVLSLDFSAVVIVGGDEEVILSASVGG
jgi:hypothetical protein